jgi:translocation and assembly module TamB
VRLTASGVRLRSGPAAALPAANATATLALEGGAARVDARVTAGASTVTVAGRVMPTIDVTASARNVSPSLGAAFVPSLASATGTIGADARVTGTPARPEGTVRLTATDLRVRSGAAAGLPPANITANAALAGTQARIDTRLTAGRNEATVVGTVPLGGSGALGLRANGNVDLAVLNPVVEANGERVLGRLTLAATIEGSVAAPAIRGTGQLTGGDFQDYGAGVHLGSIDAALEANGQTATLTRFSAKAGPGTVSASGSVGLTGTMPVNLTLTARNAQPIASSLVTANLDSNLTVSGAIRTGLALGGNITIDSANIQVPEKLPTTVAVLDVRRPGQAPPAPAQPAVNIALDLTVTAPGRIFIRGRGIDAELEGNLHVSGTSAAPRPSGSFTMRRGTFSIIGRTITFTTGEVFFDGSGKIDPRLNFVASTTTSNGTVANIAVTGYASSPKITLSSTPQLPQDEILAQVLFGQSVASLSPFQLAEIAAAVAQLTGVTGSGNLDVLGSVRKSLGLDQLSIGSGASGNGAALQLGRYVAPGVFLGAQQGTSGGSQANVTIDLTKRLKLKAGVGTPGTATGATTSVDQSGGTSMGLSYQFQY